MKILAIELAKVLANKETGLFVFQNKDGGVIRVFLKNGEIVGIDGTYGENVNELGRLFLWEGEVIKKPLPKDFKSDKKYEIPGFYKVLVWKIIDSQKETRYDINFEKLKQKISEAFTLIDFKIEKGLFYDFSEILNLVKKYTSKNVVIVNEDFIAFFDNNQVIGIFSRWGFIDYQKALQLSKENFYEWKIYMFPESDFEKLLKELNLND